MSAAPAEPSSVAHKLLRVAAVRKAVLDYIADPSPLSAAHERLWMLYSELTTAALRELTKDRINLEKKYREELSKTKEKHGALVYEWKNLEDLLSG